MNPAEIARNLIEAFSEMIFIHGFIHADPHPGYYCSYLFFFWLNFFFFFLHRNILVRRGPRGKPQLILLDHGLYRELNDTFRSNFCRFWRALVMQDREAIIKYGREIGAGEQGEVLASMFSGLRNGGQCVSLFVLFCLLVADAIFFFHPQRRRMVTMARFTKAEVNASIDNLRKRYTCMMACPPPFQYWIVSFCSLCRVPQQICPVPRWRWSSTHALDEDSVRFFG